MNNQVNEVLEKIREVCDLKRLEFGCEVKLLDYPDFPNAHGTYAGKQYQKDFDGKRHMVLHPNSELFPMDRNIEIIGFPVQLNHLLWALGSKQHLDMHQSGNGLYVRSSPDIGDKGMDYIRYEATKSVEDNLRSNPELTKWVHGVIIGKE